MQKKVWLSGAVATLGVAMLIAAAFAGPASSKANKPFASGQKKGGTMNVNMSGTDVDYIDPTLAYGTISWAILDSVCVKLYYYPDKPDPVGSKLAPDGATGLPIVSKDGKTYTFTVKSGVRSNTGQSLTAANFAFAINRVLNPKMQSPAVPFITGDSGIVGADAVVAGKAASASGVKASGQKLSITLLKPDGSLLSKLAMNFFCALPANTAIDANGINKGRYFLNRGLNVDYAAMNMSRPAFANATLRKAANYAIDRPAMVRVRGYLAGFRNDQILPPGLGGYKDLKLYPIAGSNYARAKSLASSAGGCKDVTIYTGTTPVGQNLGQTLKFNLSQMGCNVNVKLFQGFQIYIAAGTKGEPFDVVLGGWFADYADPYDFIDILLNGENIHESNNNNLAYMNVAAVNKQMAAANALTGDKRYAAYAALDLNINKNYAPWMAYENRNTREFVAARIGGYLFQAAHGLANLNTFFIK